MNTIEMRRLRQEMVENAKTLIDTADSGKRDLTEDELRKLTEMKDEIGKFDEQIKLRDDFDRLAAEQRGQTGATKPDVEVPAEHVLWRDAPAPNARQKDEIEHRFGQFLKATVYEKRAPTGMGEQVASDGGFLVQQDFATELLRRAYTGGQITSRCRRVPISANANGLKIYGIDETSRAAGSRWGGIRGYWLAEAAGPNSPS